MHASRKMAAPRPASPPRARSHTSSNTAAAQKVSQDLLSCAVLTTQPNARQSSQLLSDLTENLK